MFHRSKVNFWNIYKNLSDEWYLLDNSYETFNEIAFGKNDELNIVNDKVFNIFIEDVR